MISFIFLILIAQGNSLFFIECELKNRTRSINKLFLTKMNNLDHILLKNKYKDEYDITLKNILKRGKSKSEAQSGAKSSTSSSSSSEISADDFKHGGQKNMSKQSSSYSFAKGGGSAHTLAYGPNTTTNSFGGGVGFGWSNLYHARNYILLQQ